MSRIKNKDTTPELIVRRFLFKLGYRYRINDKRYIGRPDVVLPMYHTVIFVHGCFWHCHDGCSHFKMPKSNLEYWNKKLANNVTRDKENERYYLNKGWKVLIVWECQLASKNRLVTLSSIVENLNL